MGGLSTDTLRGVQFIAAPTYTFDYSAQPCAAEDREVATEEILYLFAPAVRLLRGWSNRRRWTRLRRRERRRAARRSPLGWPLAPRCCAPPSTPATRRGTRSRQ